MDRLRCLLRWLGRPEGLTGRRTFGVWAGGAVAVTAAGASVGFLYWRAFRSGEDMALAALLGGWGAAFAAALGPAGIAAGGPLSGRVLGAALVDSTSGVLCVLSSILGVLAAFVHEAGYAGAAAVFERTGVLVLAWLAALAAIAAMCGRMAALVYRRGCKALEEEGGR